VPGPWFGKRRETALREAEAEAEMIKKERILQAKEKFMQLKSEHDRQFNERNQKIVQTEQEIRRIEQNIQNQQRELEAKLRANDELKEQMQNQMQLLDHKREEIDRLHREQNLRLEQISGISSEDAKNILVENMKAEAKSEAAAYVNETIEEAKMTAAKEAKRIIVASIQRVATETAIENAVTVFNIESDEVKGRIIGREGRNIRALEAATGIEIIVDDTPEAIILSGFDPVRREIARLSLHQLVTDGRIHPARIEEVYDKVCKDMKSRLLELGNKAIQELGLTKIDPELVSLIGRLHFRTSYGQNALQHSMEVAKLTGLMASELGENVNIAKRAGLLHDIGKSIDFEVEGSHVEIGANIAKKYHENAVVLNAIMSHHGDADPTSIISWLVQIADTLSAARPGARNDSFDNYIQRLENLEKIGAEMEGVEKSYALQAGRELRVMVKPDEVDDLTSFKIARDIKEKIEAELQYPGTIKVTVIRETRAQEEAK